MTTLYSCNINLQTILKDLEYDIQNILKWFQVNQMKTNPKKLQFMRLGKSTRQSIILSIDKIKIREFSYVVLPDITTFMY